ncbi:C40 family peptidase [Amnibacterium sp.]|uniref:C40 family peptidase n=1 Tax=Amnibacterium sp. TaxID=1872496 RepID=UPI003F7CAFCD
MTYADVVNQMQAIQAVLLQAGVLQAPARASSTSGQAFASALDSATAAAPAAGATTAAAPASTTTAAGGVPAPATVTASTDGTVVAANGATGDDVVQAALGYVGTPYVLGGESTSGIDCSGLVQAAFAGLGVSVPRLVHEQATVGQPVASLQDAKPGDLIVLNGGNHIAIYLGNDTVIHAPYPGRTVSVQKAWFTDKDITTIRRIVPAPTTGASAAGSTDSTSSTGLSLATVARATALLGMLGANAAGSSSAGSGSPSSLADLLSSFGVTGGGTAGASVLDGLGTGGSSSLSSATQQILAAQSAMYGAS